MNDIKTAQEIAQSNSEAIIDSEARQLWMDIVRENNPESNLNIDERIYNADQALLRFLKIFDRQKGDEQKTNINTKGFFLPKENFYIHTKTNADFEEVNNALLSIGEIERKFTFPICDDILYYSTKYSQWHKVDSLALLEENTFYAGEQLRDRISIDIKQFRSLMFVKQ